jgi:hypothetical protein
VHQLHGYLHGYFTFSSERERERERGEEATFNLGNNQKIALEETLIWTLWGEGIFYDIPKQPKKERKKKKV